MKRKKRGQVWIETVLYSLIGLALIGVALAIITPKINASKDRLVVEQTIDSLNIIDLKIVELLDRGQANVRIIDEFSIKKGELYFNANEDKIIFVIDDLSKPYSTPGEIIKKNNVEIISEEGNKNSKVFLTLDYAGVLNLTYVEGLNNLGVKKITPAAIAYAFRLENKGIENDLDVIEFSERS